MAENWKNCFEEELICPICLHVFVEPVQLPCKHNFCRGCIGEAWAKDSGLVRCPECNQAYNQKPGLEKNLKLTNIVEKFNALHVEKPPAALHCVFCRRGPPLPAQKVCLRCEAPCCQSHVQTHLQQPSTARGHLLVEADDVRAWSCPQHNAYRLYHCEAEQVAVCQYCCYYSGAHQGHSVCDVEIRRNEIRKMLMKQQDRLEEREQDIEDQLYKLESDKRLVEEKVSQLKEEVRLQYEKLHQLLDEDLRQTVEVLDKAQAKFCSENAAQALHLGERMQEAKKLLGSLQLLFDKTEDVSFMKNTKSVKILMDRTQTCTGSSLSPPKIGHLNSKLFLNEVAKKEKQLRKMLEGPFSTPVPFLQSVPLYPCGVSSSGAEKRKHSTAFPENLLDAEVTVGAGLGRGRRWPRSWESVYLKALSSLALSLSVSPFSFHSFPFPPLRLEGASASPKALGGGAVSTSPHPVLGEEGPVPTGLLLLLFFFWAV
uniref:E3 ubiquitin-protein ligase TRIM8 n=1 Tax=Sus scrofa TaxID=9823 RepID=A0A480PC70_PIG